MGKTSSEFVQKDLKSFSNFSIMKLVVSTDDCRVLIVSATTVTYVTILIKEAIFHDQTFR
ncbi:hypothetical protein SAMN04488601_101282 [Paenibacillus sp. 453mf]|nr:hypothetical protein SAMN04488601_101282 [Paenibacillus sp. 453mf]